MEYIYIYIYIYIYNIMDKLCNLDVYTMDNSEPG